MKSELIGTRCNLSSIPGAGDGVPLAVLVGPAADAARQRGHGRQRHADGTVRHSGIRGSGV